MLFARNNGLCKLNIEREDGGDFVIQTSSKQIWRDHSISALLQQLRNAGVPLKVRTNPAIVSVVCCVECVLCVYVVLTWNLSPQSTAFEIGNVRSQLLQMQQYPSSPRHSLR